MPEAEVHMVDQLAGMEGRVDDLSYVQKMERDDVSKRLKMLFKPDEDVEAPEFDPNEALNDAYETVNEGETTDTTSGIDTEGQLATRQTDRDGAGDAKKGKVQEGIMSSSDEDVVEEQDEVESLEEVLSNLNYKAAQAEE